MTDRIRRPINYYGSKERVAPTIHALIPPGVTDWVDLFCGSAIVTLSKPRHPRETINDLNGDIVNLFNVLRDAAQSADLYYRIELTPFAEQLLYQVYEMPATDDPVERAWRFLVCSWFGRGGDAHKTGFRWSKGQTTAPERSWSILPARLVPIADRLRGVCIRHEDWRKVITDYATPHCCLYVDPPYQGPVGRRYAVKMSDTDHHDLASALRASPAKVILSMNPGTIYDEALYDWHRLDLSVTGGNAQTKGELLFTNFDPNPLFAAAQ